MGEFKNEQIPMSHIISPKLQLYLDEFKMGQNRILVKKGKVTWGKNSPVYNSISIHLGIL